MKNIKPDKLVYLGPSLTNQGLTNGSVFVGDIPETYRPLLQVPEIKLLVVDIKDMVETTKAISLMGSEQQKAYAYLTNIAKGMGSLSIKYESYLGKVLFTENAEGELEAVGPNNPLPISGGGTGGGPSTVKADDITDATELGKTILKVVDPAAARTAIGAGTSNLSLGTGANNAKPGNYAPKVEEISDATAIGKTILKGTDAAAVRTAIGAGTSNLTIGTTGTTAKAGDYKPAAADISDASTVGRQVLTAADAAAARTAIGAGTSNLVIGTGANQAMAGNTPIPAAPAQGTAAELEAGTSTTPKLYSAKMIHDEIARQVAAAIGTTG